MADNLSLPSRTLARLKSIRPREFGLKGNEGRKLMRNAIKIGLQEMIRFWHKTYLRHHFGLEAFSRYPGYRGIYEAWKTNVQRRFAGMITKAKRRGFRIRHKIGNPKPFFQTGNLMREVIGKITISGS